MIKSLSSPRSQSNKKPFGSNTLAQAITEALVDVCAVIYDLGENGKEKNAVNQFGDMTLRADLTAEQTLLMHLNRFCSTNNVQMIIKGEETAVSVIGNTGQQYYGVMDGIDGSENYLRQSLWSYGTMFALAKGDNPKYSDFEIAGIALPQEKWVLLSVKGLGAGVYDIQNQAYVQLPNFLKTGYDETKVIADNYFPEAKALLKSLQRKWPRSGSTAASLAAIVIGDRLTNLFHPKMNGNWHGMFEVTRKGNLEQPVVYLFISELGGVVVDFNGRDIGHNNFLNWGHEEKVPLITAKSPEIANTIIGKLTVKN